MYILDHSLLNFSPHTKSNRLGFRECLQMYLTLLLGDVCSHGTAVHAMFGGLLRK